MPRFDRLIIYVLYIRASYVINKQGLGQCATVSLLNLPSNHIRVCVCAIFQYIIHEINYFNLSNMT